MTISHKSHTIWVCSERQNLNTCKQKIVCFEKRLQLCKQMKDRIRRIKALQSECEHKKGISNKWKKITMQPLKSEYV